MNSAAESCSGGIGRRKPAPGHPHGHGHVCLGDRHVADERFDLRCNQGPAYDSEWVQSAITLEALVSAAFILTNSKLAT